MGIRVSLYPYWFLRAWCLLTWQQLAPRLYLIFISLMLLVAFSWFGLFHSLSFWPHIFLLVSLLGIGARGLLHLTRFRFPNKRTITVAIEKANGLAHQPLSSQDDRLPATSATIAQHLFRAHQRRLHKELPPLHHIHIPSTYQSSDPFGLRFLVVLLSAVAFGFSWGSKGGQLQDTFFLSPPSFSTNPSLHLEAWVIAPSYSGGHRFYLAEGAQPPQNLTSGSEFFLNVEGGEGTLKHKKNGHLISISPQETTKNSQHFRFNLTTSTQLIFKSHNEQREWKIPIARIDPPKIAFTRPPQRTTNGMLQLDYKLDDTYGIKKAWAEITPLSPLETNVSPHPLYPILSIALDIPQSGKGRGETTYDSRAHPFAGAKVSITLHAENHQGIHIASTPLIAILPERSFATPLARALAEQRRILALDGQQKNLVSDMISALQLAPNYLTQKSIETILLSSLWTRLSLGQNDEQLRGVVTYLGQAAAELEEEEDSFSAQKKLKQVQANLRDALMRGATKDEIDHLMQDLRTAIQAYAIALAQNPSLQSFVSPLETSQKVLNESDLEKKLKELQDKAQTGKSAEADLLLAQIEESLEHIQIQKGKGRNFSPEQNLNNLADLLQNQQTLLDSTTHLEDTDSKSSKAQKKQLIEENRALQAQLHSLQNNLQSQDNAINAPLEEAKRHMDSAIKALQKGNQAKAANKQAAAIASLRQGAEALIKTSKKTKEKDPLGRPSTGQRGSTPNLKAAEGSRKILDMIRKKLDSALSQQARSYLESLLKGAE